MSEQQSETNNVEIKVDERIVTVKIEAVSSEQAKEFAYVIEQALLDMLKPRIEWLSGDRTPNPLEKPMSDQSTLERAKEWIERNAVGSAYYYEVWDDPEDDTTARTFATSCPKSDEDPDSWVTVHSVSVVTCEIEERDAESVVVKAEVILWKSDGSKGEEGDEESEVYEDEVNYYLRVWEDDIELEAVD